MFKGQLSTQKIFMTSLDFCPALDYNVLVADMSGERERGS